MIMDAWGWLKAKTGWQIYTSYRELSQLESPLHRMSLWDGKRNASK